MSLTVHVACPPGVGEHATATAAASTLPSNLAGPPVRGRSPSAAGQLHEIAYDFLMSIRL